MAAMNPLRLDWILPNVNGVNMNANPIPGFLAEDYATIVETALADGLIQMSREGERLGSADALHTIKEYVRGAKLGKDDRVLISLTDQGGVTWENMAAPQWDQYFYFSSSLPDNELRISATLASMNWDAVMAYLGWLDRIESVDVNWKTLRIATHSNYAATYWKRLDQFHEATIDGVFHLPERYAPPFVSDWLLSLSKWRLRPWDRADWSIKSKG